MNLITGFFQSPAIANAISSAEISKTDAENALNQVEILEHRVSKLTLVNLALYELVSIRLGITEADLMEKINEIDLRDGSLDGSALASSSTECEVCARTYSRKHNRCLYCGHVNIAGSVNPFA